MICAMVRALSKLRVMLVKTCASKENSRTISDTVKLKNCLPLEKVINRKSSLKATSTLKKL